MGIGSDAQQFKTAAAQDATTGIVTSQQTTQQQTTNDQLGQQIAVQQLGQQSLNSGKQRDKGILEEIKNVEFHSKELKKELDQGPPPEMGKFARTRWVNSKVTDIQRERAKERFAYERREHFFARSQKMSEDIGRNISSLPPNAESSEIVRVFTECMEGKKKVDTNALVKDSDISKEAISLKEMFVELSDKTAKTFTSEDAKEYIARYQKVSKGVDMATFRYLDEASAMEPESCFVFLYHCVANMLQYHLNALQTDKVNIEEFSKLYAISATSAIAANALACNEDYRQRHEENLEKLDLEGRKVAKTLAEEAILKSAEIREKAEKNRETMKNLAEEAISKSAEIRETAEKNRGTMKTLAEEAILKSAEIRETAEKNRGTMKTLAEEAILKSAEIREKAEKNRETMKTLAEEAILKSAEIRAEAEKNRETMKTLAEEAAEVKKRRDEAKKRDAAILAEKQAEERRKREAEAEAKRREEEAQKLAEELAAKKAEEEAKKREAAILSARKRYLYEGISVDQKAEKWLLAPYAKIAEQILGEKLLSSSDEELGLLIQRMEENLESNASAAKIYYRKQIKANPSLLGLGEETAIEETLSGMGESLLKERIGVASDIMRDAFDKVVKEKKDTISIYNTRLAALEHLAPLDILSDVLRSAEIASIIYNVKENADFDATAAELQQQAQKNIDIAKELIGEKATGKNRDAVLASLIARNGQLLLFGAPAVVHMETEYFLDYLHQFAPEAAHYEDTLLLKIKQAGIDGTHKSTVSQHLTAVMSTVTFSDEAAEEKFISEELKKLKTVIDGNTAHFDAETSGIKLEADDWKALLEWYLKNVTRSDDTQNPDGFAGGLRDFLSKSKAVSKEAVSREEYEKAHQSVTAPDLRKTSESKKENGNLLRGEGLCKWGGFGNFLEGEEDAVINELDKALKNKLFDLPGLENVNNIDDLEILTTREMSAFLTLLRANISKGIEEWKNIGGSFSHEVQRELLGELVCGKLTKENAEQRVSEVNKDLATDSVVAHMRFLSSMGGDAPEVKNVDFLHLKETAFTGIIGEKSRPVRRNLRFEAAREVWKKISEQGFDTLIQKYWEGQRGKEYPIEDINIEIDYDVSELKTERASKEKAVKAAEKEAAKDAKAADKVKKASDELKAIEEQITKLTELKKLLKKEFFNANFQREFMLRGMEGELLSYTKAGEAFTSKERTDYERTIRNLEYTVIPRYMQLDAVLRNAFGSDEEKIRSYHIKANKLIARLEPLDNSGVTDEHKKQNRERFGVSDWNEALSEIKNLVSSEKNIKDANEHAELLEENINRIKDYNEGILIPFTDVILHNKECFRTLMTGDEISVSKYLKQLEKHFKVLLEALKSYNPQSLFAKEFIIENENRFFDEGINWAEEVPAYYRKYCEHEVDGVSIDNSYKKLSENSILAPYLAQIVLSDYDGISMLLSLNTLSGKKKIAGFEKKIIANKETLNAFIQDVNNNFTKSKKIGFTQYVMDSIPIEDTEEFKKKLPELYKKFSVLDEKTKKSVKKSKSVLNKRAHMMLDIEAMRQSGIDAEKSDREIIEKLRKSQKEYQSPILAALDCKKTFDQKDVSDAEKKISKDFEKSTGMVREILIESSLSGMSSRQLEQENTKITELYKRITDADFDINGTKVHFEGDAADELLMMLYVRNKAKDVTDEEIINTGKELVVRHNMLDELSDIIIDDEGLRMERDLMVDTMNSGIYSLGKNELEDLITRKMDYIKASNIAIRIFNEETEAYGNEKMILCSGLREYFHKELLDSSGNPNEESIRAKAKELLADKDTHGFLRNSKSLMEGVSSTDEIKTASAMHTLAQQHDLEEYLSKPKHEKARDEYVKLDRSQRQIFAMALGAPGQENVDLKSTQFMTNEQQATAYRINMQEQIRKYISHEAFMPTVNYTKALNQLQKHDGTIDMDAFERAIKFTNTVCEERKKNTPVDWNRLSDGASSYAAAKRLTRKNTDDSLQEVKNRRDFFEKLDACDVGKAKKTREELNKLSEHGLAMLVYVLADRTVLDRTTKISVLKRATGTEHEYVNKEKREELKELLVSGELEVTKSLFSSAALSKAMSSLFSYQLRDDIVLSSGDIQTDDFAKGALKRMTDIDWNLLSEALSFVHEAEREIHRLNAVKQADSVIMLSRNDAAIEEYKKQQKADISTREAFESYLLEQAEKDNMAAVYAGYLELSDQEKDLFIKALGQRHLLDISKNDINLNRLGISERDYVDPNGRSALIDEYIENTMTEGGGVELEEDSYHRAVNMTLSTQINDDIDFSLKGDENLAKYLTSFSNPFKSVRETAVDWKLVQRALQFVHRASNERDIFRQDRELYVSESNLMKTGHFTFDSGHLRKNIHNSGNRFTRYLLNRIKENVSDQIPSYLQPILGGAIIGARAALSVKYADKVTKLGIFDDDDDSDFNEKFVEIVEMKKDFYDEFIKEPVGKKIGEKNSKSVNDKIETGSSHLGYANAGITGAKVIKNFGNLAFAKKKSDDALAVDKEKEDKAAKNQTQEQKKLSSRAIKRNFDLQSQGRTNAINRQVDTIISTVIEVVGSATIESDLLNTAIVEVGEFINFIRSYIEDKASIVKFFKKNGELEKMRNDYNKLDWKGEKEELSDIELIRRMKGYENYTELSTFVGIDVTRSLLFCASKYNPQKHLQYLAIGTLAAIDMKDAIGHQDSKTAETVFAALLGKDYR